MATESGIHSDLAIPPGEYLAEVIETLGMTKDELARRMVRPPTKLSPIFKGEKAITPDTALQLEKVVGVPAHVWLGLESEYRLTLARQQNVVEEQRLQDETSLVSAYCYSELARVGAVAKTTRPAEKVQELQRFFGVASLRAIPAVRRYQAAFRQGRSARRPVSPEAVVAWLRLVEREALHIETKVYDRARAREALEPIRAMTRQSPRTFVPALTSLLAGFGVALVFAPHFPNTRTHGVTFRLSPDKAVLGMTIRGAWADIFWFSLLHELGHIVLHDKGELIIESDEEDPQERAREAQADSFARNALIPPLAYKQFVARGSFAASSIREFADRIGIDAGVVVGRLQHDGLLRHDWGNQLRKRYKLSFEVA